MIIHFYDERGCFDDKGFSAFPEGDQVLNLFNFLWKCVPC